MIQMNLQNRNRLTDLEKWNLLFSGGKMQKGIVREFGMNMYTLLYLKWVTNKIQCMELCSVLCGRLEKFL